MAARKTAHATEVTAPHATRIMTCANHKGGTGKTTTAVNVSAGLALLKQQRVLLVDFDPRVTPPWPSASIVRTCATP